MVRQRGKLRRNAKEACPTQVFIPGVKADRKMLKTRKVCQLSTSEKISIIHDAVVNKNGHDNIAKLFNLKNAAVGYLVRKAKQSSGFIEELKSSDEIKRQTDSVIAEAVEQVYKVNQGIERAQDVLDCAKTKSQLKLTLARTRWVMKHRLSLRYKSVKSVSF